MLFSKAFFVTLGLISTACATAQSDPDVKGVKDGDDNTILRSVWIKFNVRKGGDREDWYGPGCHDLRGTPEIQGYEIRTARGVRVDIWSAAPNILQAGLARPMDNAGLDHTMLDHFASDTPKFEEAVGFFSGL
ncbi:hypothetical protein LOZ53_001135 [Ophidiomyces ophidiicola]|nr:hypothetical protein LOZ53_001135 [Ophidiomyces ophidiicola]